MRIENKLEATTRRERALAYAFSQQLRICSRKQDKSNGVEAGMGWSWLERWMATRLPESSMGESPASKPFESINSDQRPIIQRRIFNVVGGGKESCGSKNVFMQSENFTRKASKETGNKQNKIRLKATKTLSKSKTLPSHKLPRESIKVSKMSCLIVAGAEKMVQQNQM